VGHDANKRPHAFQALKTLILGFFGLFPCLHFIFQFSQLALERGIGPPSDPAEAALPVAAFHHDVGIAPDFHDGIHPLALGPLLEADQGRQDSLAAGLLPVPLRPGGTARAELLA